MTFGKERPPYPPPMSNGTKPQDRKALNGAKNRVRHYLAARVEMQGLDSEQVHSVHVNQEDEPRELLIADLQLLLGPDYWTGDGGPPESPVHEEKVEGPGRSERVKETHESFGYVRLSNVSSTGTTLFDSDIGHQHFVTLSIGRMSRQRDLNRDWLFPQDEIIEVAFSLAQWGRVVSSFNQGAGGPCTIIRTQEQGLVPQPPHTPRLAYSMDEVTDAAKATFAAQRRRVDELVQGHAEKLGRREMGERIRALDIATTNAAPNMTFVANSLTEHMEKVVAHARADIEAMVDDRARQLGIDPTVVLQGLMPVTSIPELTGGGVDDDDPVPCPQCPSYNTEPWLIDGDGVHIGRCLDCQHSFVWPHQPTDNEGPTT